MAHCTSRILQRAQNKIDIAVALISSGCYIDCLHGRGNIYAQNANDQYHGDDSELTTFEEEALRDEESDDAESDDNRSDEETTIAAMVEIFSGLTICDVGTSTVDSETEVHRLTMMQRPARQRSLCDGHDRKRGCRGSRGRNIDSV
jgi:hypothetical protein